MATIDDIASRAGVSRDTAARILRGVGKGMRRDAVRRAERVLDVARQLGYRPNAAAKAVSSGRFNAVALLDDHDVRTHYLPSALLDAIGQGLSARGVRLTYSSISETSLSGFSLDASIFHEKHCDGYLINYLKPVPEAFLEWQRQHRVKCVWLNNRTGSHCVHMDDHSAGCQAAELLLESGHRRIGYLGPDPVAALAHSSVVDRHAGFRMALDKAGIAARHDRFCQGHAEAFAVARELLAGPRRPSAILAYESYYALPVLMAAWSRRLKIPEDLALVCISDHPVTEGGIPIDTMVLDVREMGAAAVDMLMAFIEGRRTDGQVAVEPRRFQGQTLGHGVAKRGWHCAATQHAAE